MTKACGKYILTMLAFLAISCKGGGESPGGADLREAESLFIETGYLHAVGSRSIVMPWYNHAYGQPQLTSLAPEGTMVQSGDIVAELDKAGVLKALESGKDALEMAGADLSSMEKNHATQLEKLNSELQQRLNRFHQAQIDTQRVAYESVSRKKIKLLELENAGIALEKARRKIEATKLVQEQDLKIQQAKIEQTRAMINMAERVEKSFILIAPAPGMVVYSINQQDRERRKVQVGDKLYPGMQIVHLPDLSRMKAETTVNETDISRIRVGQKVLVRLDAYPRKVFDGVITTIAHTCHPKNRNSNNKVFDVQVLVEGNDRILKPGMTVSCEFLSVVEQVAVLP